MIPFYEPPFSLVFFFFFLFPPSFGEFWISLIADANAFRSVLSDDVDPDFYRIDLDYLGVRISCQIEYVHAPPHSIIYPLSVHVRHPPAVFINLFRNAN